MCAGRCGHESRQLTFRVVLTHTAIPVSNLAFRARSLDLEAPIRFPISLKAVDAAHNKIAARRLQTSAELLAKLHIQIYQGYGNGMRDRHPCIKGKIHRVDPKFA